MIVLRIIFPVLLISLVAIYIRYIVKEKSEKDVKKEKQEENYMFEGLVIGMCLGIAVDIASGKDDYALGMIIGAALGMILGSACKK